MRGLLHEKDYLQKKAGAWLVGYHEAFDFSNHRFLTLLSTSVKCIPFQEQLVMGCTLRDIIMISMRVFCHHSFTIPSQFPCSRRLQYPSFPSLIRQISSSSATAANPSAVVDAIELFR